MKIVTASHRPRRLRARRRVLLAIGSGLVAAAVSYSCASFTRHGVESHTSPSPSRPWVPPAKVQSAQVSDTLRAKPELPADLLENRDSWTLENIIDLTLRNNPATRATWAAARASAAALASERGAYFPQLMGTANYTRQKSSFSQQLSVEQSTYGPSLALHFILFDFGKRWADVEEARQNLYRANWTHNATIQNVVLEVERTYYEYLYTKAARDADSADVKEAGANLDAAEERHKAGLATVADVLQARSDYAQKKLALQTVEGQIQTIRGSLATAMGLPPNIDYDIGLLPVELPVAEVSLTVDELIRVAEQHRPDLSAARAGILSAKAHTRSVQADGRPSISLDGSVSRRFYNSHDDYSNLYSEGVFLNWPFFTGFSHENDVLEARMKADLAQQDYEALKSQVDLDVWTSYYDLKTAGERITTAAEFLASADESQNVALERYRAGVGSILELLSAQTALENARAQDLQARTDWFLAIAQLAYATGRLDISDFPGATQKLNEEDTK